MEEGSRFSGAYGWIFGAPQPVVEFHGTQITAEVFPTLSVLSLRSRRGGD